jgi:hypothetical protein
MDYHQAVDTYIQGLVDIGTILHTHHEARTELAPSFLIRALQDGFLQPVSGQDRQRLMEDHDPQEHCLLWYGDILQQKRHWNAIGWLFPFHTMNDMERAYELITRAELARKSWAPVRQFWLSCRFKLQEAPISIPTNIVKMRVKGQACTAAMFVLEQSPPNLRYVTKAVVDRLPSFNYFRKRTHLKIVIGERLEPQIQIPNRQGHAV